VLCTLNTAGKTGGEVQEAKETESPVNETSEKASDHRLSPAVRQRILQHKLDISDIAGSGRDGRITLQDVEALIAVPAMLADVQTTEDSSADTHATEIIPHDKMRKRIADSMVTSLMHTAPHVTAVFEADLSAVMQHRAANKEVFASRGTPLTLTVYFVAAAIAAIKNVPNVNSRWHDEHLEVFHHINMGIGTALGDQGLIVPVLHDAHKMGIDDIASALADVTSRARDGKLNPQDVRGGTFTISNHGVSGSLIATPIIISQPQSAILGVGKIEKRIKIREIDGEDVIAIRPMCYISLTIDHRVLDGFQTNAFLTVLVSTLENWSD
jgi:2-oxoglutarate dehydrogenase E2 component (dihydrolipoamide succinyltransferase)